MNGLQIQSTEMLEVINRTEIDMQIATAKRYPRDLPTVLRRIRESATEDSSVAQECFYALPRNGETIEGLSVRMAEIMAGAWGNLRVQTRIIGNDGKTITAQGICHDLETNTAVSVEVKRSILDKKGNTYTETMQVTTGNAASAIAFRNAVLKIIPKAVTNKTIDEVKNVAIGKAKDLKTRREGCIASFEAKGISKDVLLNYLEIERVEDIDSEMLFDLVGLYNSIKEGMVTAEEIFGEANQKQQGKTALEKAKAAKAKAIQAAQRQTKAQVVDAEVINDKGGNV